MSLTFQTERKHEYELHCGFFGNGEVVYNVRFEENNDYEYIAHIDGDGTISWKKKNLPADVVAWVEKEAKRLAAQEVKWYHIR